MNAKCGPVISIALDVASHNLVRCAQIYLFFILFFFLGKFPPHSISRPEFLEFLVKWQVPKI